MLGDVDGDTVGALVGDVVGDSVGAVVGDSVGLMLGLAVGAVHPRHVTMQLARTYALIPHCCRDSRSWHSDVDR